MGNYRLTEEAKDDLRRIYRYGFEKHGEKEADKYYSALFDRFDQLAEQPLLYSAVDDIREGYRRSVCGSDSIYYRIEGETVEIIAIIGQQDLANGFRKHGQQAQTFGADTGGHQPVFHELVLTQRLERGSRLCIVCAVGTKFTS